MRCQNNLKQLGLAVHMYHDQQDLLPSATVPHPELPPEQRFSWVAPLLPYLEHKTVYDKLDLEQGWRAKVHQEAIRSPVGKILLCPSHKQDHQEAQTSYVGIAGVGTNAASWPLEDRRAGMFGHDRRITWDDITDGTSNTMMFVETSSNNGPWAAGGPPTVRGVDPLGYPYVARGGPFGVVHRPRRGLGLRRFYPKATTAFADGSVRTLTEKVGGHGFAAAATIAGGEKIRLGF